VQLQPGGPGQRCILRPAGQVRRLRGRIHPGDENVAIKIVDQAPEDARVLITNDSAKVVLLASQRSQARYRQTKATVLRVRNRFSGMPYCSIARRLPGGPRRSIADDGRRSGRSPASRHRKCGSCAIDFSQQIGGQMVEDIQLQFAIEDWYCRNSSTGVDGISSRTEHSANEKSNFAEAAGGPDRPKQIELRARITFQQQFETRRLPVVSP